MLYHATCFEMHVGFDIYSKTIVTIYIYIYILIKENANLYYSTTIVMLSMQNILVSKEIPSCIRK